MANQNDVENFTHNQLEVSKIKHLKRVASALESIAESLSKGVEVRITPAQITTSGDLKLDVDWLDDNRPMVRKLTPEPLVPDENPDATDLGLTREEEQEIEREVNKQPVKKGKK